MNHTVHNTIVGFIWNIADDVLRDVYVRGKYRDVILPMTVLRRLDCLLEPTKTQVLERKQFLEQKAIYAQDANLRKVSQYPFYNTSRFTFRTLLDEPTNIRANFQTYLDGYSDNVREIITKFRLHNQLQTLDESNRLYPLIQKFVSNDINLSPEPVRNGDGTVRLPGLSNHDMGSIFEELIRRFNEQNNEEAGEHFTPRDVIKLMVNLIFLPIKGQIESGTYLVYDCACGSGGMLTEADARLQQLAGEAGKHVSTQLYGQEVNPETFAICQSDMLIKERDPANIYYGSTLSDDGFPQMQFDFMLANPPYGKSWKVDQEAIFDEKKKIILDPRFVADVPDLPDGEQLRLLPRSSDGQLLFLVNMLTKMKSDTPSGSRVAVIHNGSALFTGSAGQGESNIRRWIIENDWLEAIIGLPLDMFYNTGIATYVWILSNRKPAHRRGKVQLIDATGFYRKLRKNLGKKNCELGDDDIRQVTDLFLNFAETEHSKIFDNADFGYHQITVERPLRLRTHVTPERLAQYRQQAPARLHPLADALPDLLGREPISDYNEVQAAITSYAKEQGLKLGKGDLKLLREQFTERDEHAAPVIAKQTRHATEYEPDSDLRDTEQVPLKEEIADYFAREVLPYVPDAWIDHSKTQRGYEISFTRYFYQYEPLRSLEEITADILALEQQTEGLLHRIIEDTRETAE
jgi:type I restriction enzyme M protein